MLPKFEYGHLYKFAVSLGLLMVALGLALPWLVLRESGSLLIPESELDALTPQARRVLLNKQGDQEWIADNYRYASIGLVVTGLAVGCFGFVKWASRQSVADEIEDTQRDTAQAQLRQLTPSETKERLDQESAEVLAEESEPREVEEPSERERRLADVRKRIERIEHRVFEVLLAEFESTHRVVMRVGLLNREGSDVDVDALVIAPKPHDTSYAIEIKFLRSAHPGLMGRRLRETTPHVALAASLVLRWSTSGSTTAASTNIPRQVAGIVILVMAQEPTDGERSLANRQVKDLRPGLAVPVGVVVTSESELEAGQRGRLRRSVEDSLVDILPP